MQTEIVKPKAKVLGKDGNVFNIMGICSQALKKAGQKENADKMTNEVIGSKSYHEALAIMGNYCDLI